MFIVLFVLSKKANNGGFLSNLANNCKKQAVLLPGTCINGDKYVKQW